MDHILHGGSNIIPHNTETSETDQDLFVTKIWEIHPQNTTTGELVNLNQIIEIEQI